MYSIADLKRMNEERVFVASLSWYLRILVKWGLLNIKWRKS